MRVSINAYMQHKKDFGSEPTKLNVQGEYKLSVDFVTVAVCTGTTADFSVEFTSLWAAVSSALDWLSAQISRGCE
jgi:hypothetical protein